MVTQGNFIDIDGGQKKEYTPPFKAIKNISLY